MVTSSRSGKPPTHTVTGGPPTGYRSTQAGNPTEPRLLEVTKNAVAPDPEGSVLSAMPCGEHSDAVDRGRSGMPRDGSRGLGMSLLVLVTRPDQLANQSPFRRHHRDERCPDVVSPPRQKSGGPPLMGIHQTGQDGFQVGSARGHRLGAASGDVRVPRTSCADQAARSGQDGTSVSPRRWQPAPSAGVRESVVRRRHR